jgi:hypothetical protein
MCDNLSTSKRYKEPLLLKGKEEIAKYLNLPTCTLERFLTDPTFPVKKIPNSETFASTPAVLKEWLDNYFSRQ